MPSAVPEPNTVVSLQMCAGRRKRRNTVIISSAATREGVERAFFFASEPSVYLPPRELAWGSADLSFREAGSKTCVCVVVELLLLFLVCKEICRE